MSFAPRRIKKPFTVPENLIEYSFDATFNAWSTVKEKQPNGSTHQKEKKIYEDKPCGIYVHRAEEFNPKKSIQPQDGDFRMFTFRELTLRKGDKIEFTQYGLTYKCIAGAPIRYETHQEIVMHEVELA